MQGETIDPLTETETMYRQALYVLTVATVIFSYPQTTSAQPLTSITLFSGYNFGIVHLGISAANRNGLSGCWWRHYAYERPLAYTYGPYARPIIYLADHRCTWRHRFWSPPTNVYRHYSALGHFPHLGWHLSHRPLYRAGYWDHPLRGYPIRAYSSQRLSSRRYVYGLAPRPHATQSHRTADRYHRDDLALRENRQRELRSPRARVNRSARRLPARHGSVLTSTPSGTIRPQANRVRAQDIRITNQPENPRRTRTSMLAKPKLRRRNNHQSSGHARRVIGLSSPQRTVDPRRLVGQRDHFARNQEPRAYRGRSHNRPTPQLSLRQGSSAQAQTPSSGRLNRFDHSSGYTQAERGSSTLNHRSSRVRMSSPRVQPSQARNPSTSPVELARMGLARTPATLRNSNRLRRAQASGSRSARSRRE